jgi:hypothetical protein
LIKGTVTITGGPADQLPASAVGDDPNVLLGFDPCVPSGAHS